MIEILKPRNAAIGTQRFVVRKSLYMPLDAAALLRQSYNEYPERFAQTPAFPRAGKRAGSRPPSAQNALGAGAAPGVNPSPGAPPGSPGNPDLYPPPRDRDEGPDIQTGTLPPTGSPEASSIQNCIGAGGFIVHHSPQVAATTTVVNVSDKIPFPFVIAHVIASCNQVQGTDTAVLFLVSADNDTSGGENTTGTHIKQYGTGAARMAVYNSPFQTYPNFRVPSANFFIKTVFRNNTAGAVEFDVWYSIHALE